jgi:hypothetical protein
MNQVDTSDEKLLAKRSLNIIFGIDGDTTLSSSKPRTPTAAMTTTMTLGCR